MFKFKRISSKKPVSLGDIDTSSSESSEAQSSDSDDDISRTSRKGTLELCSSLSFSYNL